MFVALEARLTKGEADALATRLPKLRRMLAARVLFFRDPRDQHDLDQAFAKIEAAIAAAAEPFETADWPPRPAPKKKGKPRRGRRMRPSDVSFEQIVGSSN